MSDIHTLRKVLSAKHLDAKPGDGERSPHWPAVRAAHLKQHPKCEACGGTENAEVHHKMPFHLDPSKELDESNLITLCEKPSTNCHFHWGHNAESWSEFNPEVVSDSAAELKRITKRRAESKKETK